MTNSSPSFLSATIRKNTPGIKSTVDKVICFYKQNYPKKSVYILGGKLAYYRDFNILTSQDCHNRRSIWCCLHRTNFSQNYQPEHQTRIVRLHCTCHSPTLTSHIGPWCCDLSQHIPAEFLDKHVQCTTGSCRYSYLLSTNKKNKSERLSTLTTLRLAATPLYVTLAISTWFWDIPSQTDL